MQGKQLIVSTTLVLLLVVGVSFLLSSLGPNNDEVLQITESEEASNTSLDTPPAEEKKFEDVTAEEPLSASSTTEGVEPIVVTNIPEGWKTYTNEEKRFGFAYPANWDIDLNWKAFLKNRDDADQFGHVRVFGDGYQFGVTYFDHKIDTDLFGYVDVAGDGYVLIISTLDHGFERDGLKQKLIPNIYISRKETRVWEAGADSGAQLIVVVPSCNNMSFFVKNEASNSKDLLYQIISTAVCE